MQPHEKLRMPTERSNRERPVEYLVDDVQSIKTSSKLSGQFHYFRRYRDIVHRIRQRVLYGQGAQPLIREPPVSLMERHRTAATAHAVGLANDGDHGLLVWAPQATTAKTAFHWVGRLPVQPGPATGERRPEPPAR